MKLKIVGTLVLAVLLLGSCKSKKRTVKSYEPQRQERVVVEVDTITKKEFDKVIPKSEITETTEDYIEMFSEIAMEEMRKFKIPASITLAQGVLESSSGKSELTKRSNNHFGIKCHKGWNGKKTYHDDDEKGECFRVYKDPRNSYKDHSEFLTTRSRYASLFLLDEGDYIGWAEGLSKAGYATDRRYPAKLIGIIEKYDLHKYDLEVLGYSYKKKKPKQKHTHIVVKGDTLYSLSRKYNLSVSDLKMLNKLDSNTISVGQTLRVK